MNKADTRRQPTTFELAPTADEERAQILTDHIKYSLAVTWDLIVEAYEIRAWEHLGYTSWDDYCTAEFGSTRLRVPREERQEAVESLRDAGMSIRAIASATGYGETTVRREIKNAEQRQPTAPNGAVDRPEADDEIVDAEVVPDDEPEVIEPEPRPIIGVNGKTYRRPLPSKKPKRKPLPDICITAAYDIEQAIGKFSRLTADDRFPQNAKKVARQNLGALLRSNDLLTQVVAELQNTIAEKDTER